ncbi:ABC-type Fe3+-siderophore transport system, permease component [Rubellimicrobium thermophilum DSM 16684]|uniref:ABC-type Fe3+-siderophore transport system, permease component n=1 Tax=Rubellimicrobium thermophilum DSM 16684 TaxID=1123069 RepID=S9QSX3_9RHOB|nr:iron ABC transporter permease [Rubellimicrobium thermophilum]EPX82758.1 ABC-type Fe3+-siderophore transport system, permease component [Rubellimicrobium thermophilum DSM 16684]
MRGGVWRIRAAGGVLAFETPLRPLIVLSALCAGLAATGLISLLTGSYGLSWGEAAALLARPEAGSMASTVIWELRFPRMLVALMTGAMLALSGAILQGITRNPLADPSLVGVSQGAALAVVALIVLWPEALPGLRPLIAFGGAIIVAAAILSLSRGADSAESGATLRFVLMGIGVAAFLSAVTGAMLTYGRIEAAQSALGWLSGSIHAAGWGEVRVLALVLLALTPALIWAGRPIGALQFGPAIATGLGVAVPRTRAVLILLSVALAATAVSAVGPLGFVGLVAPHVARRLAHAGPGLHLALSAATGALMVGLADLVGRAAFAPLQIPAGLVTAMVGAPAFALLILRSQARRTL